MSGKLFGAIIGAIVAGPAGIKLGAEIGEFGEKINKLVPSTQSDPKKEIPAANKYIPPGNWCRTVNSCIVLECPHCQGINREYSTGYKWKCSSCESDYTFALNSEALDLARKGDHPNNKRALYLIFQLLGVIAKADGQVTSEEANFVQDFLVKNKLDIETQKTAIQFFNKGRDKQSYTTASRSLKNIYPYNANHILNSIVRDFIKLASADGNFDDKEKEVIRQITFELGLDKNDFPELAIEEHGQKKAA